MKLLGKLVWQVDATRAAGCYKVGSPSFLVK